MKAHSGEHQSLTKALNIVRKLRAMGAVRMSVGSIAVDFQEEASAQEEDGPNDVLETNELEDFKNIDKWARS